MVYNDVVKPAKTGIDIAKHGNVTVLTPGINNRQILEIGISNPVSINESKLTNRFDDNRCYANSVTGNVQILENCTWIAPYGIPSVINIKAWGQGGYGESGEIGGTAGTGGGGGAYSESEITPVPGRGYAVLVNTGIVNGDGGDSVFKDGVNMTTYCSAIGGKSGANGGEGGDNFSGIGNITQTPGSNGGSPIGFGGGEGGGGGNGEIGGLGGGDFGGNQSDGENGTAPGGGGGGGSLDPVQNMGYAGGAGGLGKVIISW